MVISPGSVLSRQGIGHTLFDDVSHLRLSVRRATATQSHSGRFVIGLDVIGEEASALLPGDNAVARRPRAFRASMDL